MDEELLRYLEAMEGRLTARMNDQHERVLNRLMAIERDLQLVSGGRWFDLEARVT